MRDFRAQIFSALGNAHCRHTYEGDVNLVGGEDVEIVPTRSRFICRRRASPRAGECLGWIPRG
jgi:predicted nucleotidyltransferase